jgi:hypothetical protein
VIDELDETVNGVSYQDVRIVRVQLLVESEDARASHGWLASFHLAPGVGVVRQVGFTPWEEMYNVESVVLERIGQ